MVVFPEDFLVLPNFYCGKCFLFLKYYLNAISTVLLVFSKSVLNLTSVWEKKRKKERKKPHTVCYLIFS